MSSGGNPDRLRRPIAARCAWVLLASLATLLILLLASPSGQAGERGQGSGDPGGQGNPEPGVAANPAVEHSSGALSGTGHPYAEHTNGDYGGGDQGGYGRHYDGGSGGYGHYDGGGGDLGGYRRHDGNGYGDSQGGYGHHEGGHGGERGYGGGERGYSGGERGSGGEGNGYGRRSYSDQNGGGGQGHTRYWRSAGSLCTDCSSVAVTPPGPVAVTPAPGPSAPSSPSPGPSGNPPTVTPVSPPVIQPTGPSAGGQPGAGSPGGSGGNPTGPVGPGGAGGATHSPGGSPGPQQGAVGQGRGTSGRPGTNGPGTNGPGATPGGARAVAGAANAAGGAAGLTTQTGGAGRGAGLLAGLGAPVTLAAGTAAGTVHHLIGAPKTGAKPFLLPPSPGPNVIERIEREVPLPIWLALAAALLAAALSGGWAALTAGRVRRQEGRVAEMRTAALTDPLTGILNRRGFEQAVERELARARRYGRPFVLGYIDVRGLKRVNDSEGHLAGDRLLRHAAKLLEDSARADDVVGRLGGDEMGLLLVEQQQEGAEAVIRRIQAELPQRRETLGLSQPWDLTIGTAAFPEDGQSFEALLRAADLRLYEQRGIELRSR